MKKIYTNIGKFCLETNKGNTPGFKEAIKLFKEITRRSCSGDKYNFYYYNKSSIGPTVSDELYLNSDLPSIDYSEGANEPYKLYSCIEFIKVAELLLRKDVILWLDDVRNPFLNIEGKVPKGPSSIEWVLNYEQFTQWIEKFGLPKVISFDHDLADEHYTPEKYWNNYELSKDYQEAQNYTEKTGMDCAKWLVEYCMDNNEPLPTFYSHSANPVGRDNILGLLNNYLKHSESDG